MRNIHAPFYNSISLYKNSLDRRLIEITKLLIVLIALQLLSTGCSTIPNPYNYFNEVADKVVPITIDHEISDRELLNVSIKVFDPGKLPDNEKDKIGLSNEIRNAETRYMPNQLKYTLQRTGYWGNVRVVPDDNVGSDLLLKGVIKESNGETLELKIKVIDAGNKQWFEKTYRETVTADNRRKTEEQKEDNFQDLYNKISNDIIKFRNKLTEKEIVTIKQVSEIRFAQFMAKDTFDDYLELDKNGQYKLNKLPSIDDPMMKRVRLIGARDDLLIDSINNYYDIYYSNMWEAYDNWRKYRSEELEAIREIESEALLKKAIGVAAVVGAIALGASSNDNVRLSTGTLRTVMIAGGSYALYKGFEQSKETELNEETIEELGESFSADIEPMVIDLQDKTMQLTGSAEQQYVKWRKLLKQIYKKETGFD